MPVSTVRVCPSAPPTLLLEIPRLSHILLLLRMPVCRLIADINSESSTPRSAPTQAYNPIKKTAGDSGGLFDVVLAHKCTVISAGLGEAMIDALVSSALAP